MALPPYYMLITQNGVLRYHLWCLSTPPQCGIPTFTVGTCSNGVKIKTKGFIGRFENNRELLRKGIGRSPFPFSRNFEIFRETTLKTLVIFEGLIIWVLNFSMLQTTY